MEYFNSNYCDNNGLWQDNYQINCFEAIDIYYHSNIKPKFIYVGDKHTKNYFRLERKFCLFLGQKAYFKGG